LAVAVPATFAGGFSIGTVAAPVPQRQLEAGVRDVGRHERAHPTEAREPDPLHTSVMPPSIITI
jgi:hypothetical protein